jgi:hypothetical protein
MPGAQVVLSDGGWMTGTRGCPHPVLRRMLGTGIGPSGVRRFGWRHVSHCCMHLHTRFASRCRRDSRERAHGQTEREYEEKEDPAPMWHGRSLPRGAGRYDR